VATIAVTDSTIRLELSLVETLGCGIRRLDIPRDEVTEVQVLERPFADLRGVRAPGIGLPKTIAIGRWRHRGGTDLVILRRDRRAMQLDLGPSGNFRRIVVGTAHPEETRRRLQEVTA
jgi:hypothetical protein